MRNHFLNLLILICFISELHAVIPETDRVKNGHYLKIIEDESMKETGAWAFARYFIAADKLAYEAALASHEKGDLIGSYILMKCHDDGVGVRRDPKVKWEMNFLLRTKLEPIEKPNGIESYILAELSQADLKGAIDVSSFKDPKDAYVVAGKYGREHLVDSAEKGFAQAIVEVGLSHQSNEPKKAFSHYTTAANLGIASGMKDLGYVYARGIGTEQDAELAYEWTRKAAAAGDIYAHLNMPAFFQRMNLPGSSIEEARQYVEKSANHPHPLGQIEKAIQLWKGINGYKVDKEGAMTLMQEAANSGHKLILGQIAYFFTSGELGVPKDYRKAIEFGKAAWIQGNESAAKTITQAYQQLPKPTKLDEKNAGFWKLHAMGGGLAFALGEDKNARIDKELAATDPFSLKIK